MENTSSSRRPLGTGGGLPRSPFSDDFIDHHPFRTFDPPQRGGLPRTFTERGGRLFDDDFFDVFPNNGGGAGRRPFHDEPPFFRSSLSRRPFGTGGSGGGIERPIPVQRQQTSPQRSPILERREAHSAPFHHQRSKSHYDNANNGADWDHYNYGRHPHYNDNGDDEEEEDRHSHSRHFPSSGKQPVAHPNDPPPSSAANAANVHRIQIRQEKPKGGGQQQFVEINNAQPNYTNGALNPDKRRRFSNASGQSDHDYAQSRRSPSIPNIVIDDYGDGRPNSVIEKGSPVPSVIPLPAPAIPLPAPEGMMKNAEKEKENAVKDEAKAGKEKKEEESDVKLSREEENHAKNSQEKKPQESHRVPINFVPLAESGEHLIRLLDETERQVESLRETAARLEHEKEGILERIKNIKLTEELLKLSQGHRDELELNADRILTRCQAVNVSVNTPRDEHQEIALQKVEEVIQSVVNRMQEDLTMAEAKIRGFLNACMPDESGHIDEKFQSLIIACTADDQKRIRRRLAQTIEQIERAKQFSPSASR